MPQRSPRRLAVARLRGLARVVAVLAVPVDVPVVPLPGVVVGRRAADARGAAGRLGVALPRRRSGPVLLVGHRQSPPTLSGRVLRLGKSRANARPTSPVRTIGSSPTCVA